MKRRRMGILVFAASVLIVASAMQQQRAATEHVFFITFGLKDEKPGKWDGQVEVTGGEVAALEGWRFEGKEEVTGKSAWKCETHEYIAPGERYQLETPGEPKPKAKLQPWPNGITLTVRGNKPIIKVTFGDRPIEVDAEKIKLGEPQKYLGDQVQVERLPEVKILRPAE